MRLRFLWYLLCILLPHISGAADAPRTILVVGDSLSAGFGLAQDEGWVALLQQRLTNYRMKYIVINASISGDTTRGGLNRIGPALSKYRPAIVLIELGANDGLRGLKIGEMRANLGAMITQAQASGAHVLLIGMVMPPNYGAAYTKQFQATYVELSAQYGVPLVPFLLNGVALNSSLMQDDNLHPNAVAQMQLLDNVWPHLEPLLK